jgi:hypothetical protein
MKAVWGRRRGFDERKARFAAGAGVAPARRRENDRCYAREPEKRPGRNISSAAVSFQRTSLGKLSTARIASRWGLSSERQRSRSGVAATSSGAPSGRGRAPAGKRQGQPRLLFACPIRRSAVVCTTPSWLSNMARTEARRNPPGVSAAGSPRHGPAPVVRRPTPRHDTRLSLGPSRAPCPRRLAPDCDIASPGQGRSVDVM